MADPIVEIFRPLPAPDPRRRGPVTLPAVETRLTRTNYFDGRLLTAADLTRDQEYLDRRLRDAGRAGGTGVVEGLEAALDGTRIAVSAGVGVTASGRTIVLERAADDPLIADLLDAGAIGAANRGRAPELGDGLYALVLGHVEVESGVAEAFPADLGADRRAQVDRIADMLQLQLVPLALPVPQGADLRARAQLAAPLLLSRAFDAAVPSESVCLGVVATRLGEPAWFDPLLLRRRRVEATRIAAVEDLVRHHLAIYAEIRRERPRGEIVASEHFALLPPVGRAPREAVDPAASTQRFFPPQTEISVAPVRADELEAIVRDSLGVAPLDLSREDPAEIIVLAPLAPADFANLAPALTRDAASPRAQPLRLFGPSRLRRLFGPVDPAVGLPAVSTAVGSESDLAVWRRIFERVVDADLPYVFRPPHAASAGLSVARAATGMAGPPEGGEEEPPAEAPPIREDVAEFLRRLDRTLSPAWGSGGTDFLNARERETRLRQLAAFLAERGGTTPPTRDPTPTPGDTRPGGGGRVIAIDDLRAGVADLGTTPGRGVDPDDLRRVLIDRATTDPAPGTPVVSVDEVSGAVDRLSVGRTAVATRDLDAVIERSTFRAPARDVGRVVPKRVAPKAAPKARKKAAPKRPTRPRGGG